MADVVWTTELVSRLRQLHDTGMSFTQIARTMNEECNLRLTPNAVIGKARREALPRRAEPRWKASRKQVPTREPKSRTLSRKALGPPQGELRTISLGPPASHELTIMELTAAVCHWPHGAAPPYTYCGAPAHNESAFCLHHYNLVYVTPAKRWR